MKLTSTSSNSGIRYLISSRKETIPYLHKRKLRGLILITGDCMGVAEKLADLLIYEGAFAYVIANENCSSEETLIKEAKVATNIFGPVTGLIHLSGFKACSFPKDIEKWRKETEIQFKSLFHLLKFAHKDFGNHSTHFRPLISCSLLGGSYGRDCLHQPGLPLSGGVQGMLKSLEFEWDRIMAKMIDFDLSLSPRSIAKIIMDELKFNYGSHEVGYPMGKRVVFFTTGSPLQPTFQPRGLLPKKNWVILATGGARGITAETIRFLTNEGNRFILVGKSELTEKRKYAKYQGMDEKRLRAEFIKEAKTADGKITPGMIESKIRNIVINREMRANIALLRKLGCKVEYISCDVTDSLAFGNLIDLIYHDYGTIDIVVHGAGVIDDHLLADKSLLSFDKVFDTKVNSAFILYHKIKWESLDGCIFFSSTAGRYGNRGQSDYAAANEVLNRLAWRIRAEWPNVFVKSLNWGPWTGSGMASKSVNQHFIDRGIVPITIENGVRQFMKELLHGHRDEVEVVLGEGTWNPDRENPLLDIFNASLFNSYSSSKS